MRLDQTRIRHLERLDFANLRRLEHLDNGYTSTPFVELRKLQTRYPHLGLRGGELNESERLREKGDFSQSFHPDDPKSLWLIGSDVDDPMLANAAAQFHSGKLSFEGLYLNNSSITDAAVASLNELPHLRELYLAGTDLTPAAIARLGKFDQLETLWLDADHVDDESIAALKQWPALKTVVVQGFRSVGIEEVLVAKYRPQLPQLLTTIEEYHRSHPKEPD